MGNPDLIFIINRGAAYAVRGADYSTSSEALQKAIKQFEDEAKANIAAWHEAKERDPESVVADYRPEDEMDITSIERHDAHFFVHSV